MKLRVLIVAPTFPLASGALNGGTQAASYNLCRSLLQYEPNVEFLVVRPYAPVGTPNCLSIDGIQVRTISFLEGIPRQIQCVCGMTSRIRRVALTFQPDVVHSQGSAGLVRGFGSRGVLTLHGIAELDVLHTGAPTLRWARALWLRMTEARWRRQSPHVIAISPYSRRFFPGHLGQKIWDVPNPVTESFFQINRRPRKGWVFSPSHMTPLKNSAALIRAFAISCRAGVGEELRFAGSHQDSDYGRECQRLVIDCGISDKVKFLGLLDPCQLREELSQASVVALASQQENAPMTLAEAMAAGVPTLATRVGGIPWMVQDGQSGRLVEPKDDASLALNLQRMLAEDDLCRMGTVARQLAAEYFHPAVVARRTVEIYECIHSELTATAPKLSCGH